MRTLTLLATVLFTVSLVFSGCSKYDEGPGLSLRSKTKRLARNWKIVKIGEDYDASAADAEFDAWYDFKEDGTLTAREIVRDPGEILSYSGSWEFSDDKERLVFFILDEDGERVSSDHPILRLTSSELWWTDVDGRQWELEAD